MGLHDEHLFGDSRIENEFLEWALFDAYYRDLERIGSVGMQRLRKPRKKKIESLTRALYFFQKREDYERCAFIKQVLDDV
jgi:hypothetical protein